ncbi:PREDICTED: uncharacterized protein LOC109591002 [Amphimedon queenslandica]|uniref:Uncharacterized protein n=1 Tax=Amphimedon queenslandica TaxID=400682 RepID=A0AAN0JYS6_AMPQE|nr:PREDICTED: uncharacterized protein LOC109591002 [Amphimedon queenslandica]|eukprot:XP_019862378.1 PREDICTED: uncharacterized protein LOC109591002 [Amphimedon queenslandica]
MIGTNLYEFIPQTLLQFQEGDIFGVYSDRTDGERLVLYEQRFNGPTNLRISDSLDSPPSTISETLITINNDFPLVTVEINIFTQPTVAITSSITENILEASVSFTSFMTSLSPTMFSHIFSPSSSFSHELSIVTETMNDRQTAKVPSPSTTHSTIKPTIYNSSTSMFVISSTIPLTPATQPTEPSASFLVGGIIVGVVCIILVCTCLLIIACIIVCVKKRSKSLFKSNPEELSTSLKILTTSTNDDHDTNIDTLKDNPAYVTTTGSTFRSTTLLDNPAYTSTSNTVPVDDDTLYTYASNNSSNLYSTINF